MPSTENSKKSKSVKKPVAAATERTTVERMLPSLPGQTIKSPSHAGTYMVPEMTFEVKVDGRTICRSLGARGEERIGKYLLGIKIDRTVQISLRRVDGAQMDVESIEYEIVAPLTNYSCLIRPDSGREYMFKGYPLQNWGVPCELTCPNNGTPFWAFVDQCGRVALSVGLIGPLTESTFTVVEPGKSSRSTVVAYSGRLHLRISKSFHSSQDGRPTHLREALFVEKGHSCWFEALRDYCRYFRQRMSIQYPRNPLAELPTWCTWTAWLSEDLSESAVLKNARLARDLGIGTIILDDGWFGPGLDMDGVALNIGDYEADRRKFPDLRGMVDELHHMGLRVLLWYAPLAVSPDARCYASRRAWLIQNDGSQVLTPAGYYNLCPSNPPARAHIVSEVRRLLLQYAVDGLKIDLFNTLPEQPCQAFHEHDVPAGIGGLHHLMDEIWRAAGAINPDVLIELKNNYANVFSAQYGTMVRAGDSPYDIELNLLRALYPQAYAPVVHNDYLAWNPHESEQALSMLMIKQLLGGVPTFSVDLSGLPRGQLNLLKRWLDLYHRYRAVLAGGVRRYARGRARNWEIDGDGVRFVFLLENGSLCDLSGVGGLTFLLNASCGANVYILPIYRRFLVRVFNAGLDEVGCSGVSLADGHLLEIPQGGMAVLELKGDSV